MKKELICYLYIPLLAVTAIYLLLNVIHLWRQDLNHIIFYFVLNTEDLNTNIFLSSYTHLNYEHFASNIVMYLLLFLIIYDLIEDRTELKYLMHHSLLAFPFVISLLLILLPDSYMGMGISGIISCLWGHAIILEYRYAKRKLGLDLHFQCLIIVISFNFLLPLLYKGLYYCLIPFLVLIYFLKNQWKGIENNWLLLFEIMKKRTTSGRLYYDSLRLILPFTVSFTFVSVGGLLETSGILVHIIGWVYGMITGYLILDPDGWLSGSKAGRVELKAGPK